MFKTISDLAVYGGATVAVMIIIVFAVQAGDSARAELAAKHCPEGYIFLASRNSNPHACIQGFFIKEGQ